jgi:hypothetical protein
MSIPRALLASLPLAFGCPTGTGGAGDTGSGLELFCESMDDGDVVQIETGGGSTASGVLSGRLITDATEDIHNPNMVANWDFVLENLDVGGTQTRGKTTDLGEFTATLGAGHWSIAISGQRNGYTCANTLEFEIVAGSTTTACMDANCL